MGKVTWVELEKRKRGDIESVLMYKNYILKNIKYRYKIERYKIKCKNIQYRNKDNTLGLTDMCVALCPHTWLHVAQVLRTG